MARNTKYQQHEINAKLVSDSYACGYYGSVIASMVINLPNHKQKVILTQIQLHTPTQK